MKKFLLSITLLLLPISFASERIPITITKITDGDTVRVKMQNGNKFALRLVGIDCYETYLSHRAKSQAYDDELSVDEVIKKGMSAKEYLKELKNNAKDISFEFSGIDKYGRGLGILYFDNININQKLIDEKYCKVYEYKEK